MSKEIKLLDDCYVKNKDKCEIFFVWVKDKVFLIISILVFFLSFFMFNRYGATLNPLKLNVFSYIFWYQLVVLSFFAAIIMIYNIDGNHHWMGRAGENARLLGWFSVLWTMLMLPLGLAIGFLLLSIKSGPRLFEYYCNKQFQTIFSEKDKLIKIIIHIFFFVSIMSTIYTFRVIGTIPLINAIRSPGEAAMLAVMRIEATREFAGNTLIRNFGSIFLAQLISYTAYGYYRLTKNMSDRIFFCFSLIHAIIAVTYNLARTPFIFFLIGLMFIKIFIDGRIKKKFFILTVILALSGVVGATLLTVGTNDIRTLLFTHNDGILGRIILSQASGNFMSFEIFPQTMDHLGIRSVSRWLPSLFGMEHSERAMRLIMIYVNPGGVEAGTVNVMNSLFIGEAWANFGLAGFIFSPLIVGFVIGVIFAIFLKSRKTPLYIGMLGYLSIFLGNTITGGFMEYFYPVFIIIVISIFLSIKYLAVFLSTSIIMNRKV